MQHGSRKINCIGLTFARDAVDCRAAGMTQVEKARNFVKCFASCVINGLTNNGVFAVRTHVDKQRVATRDQHHQHWKLHQWIIKQCRVEVCFQMIDTHKWLIEHQRNRLGGGNANQ